MPPPKTRRIVAPRIVVAGKRLLPKRSADRLALDWRLAILIGGLGAALAMVVVAFSILSRQNSSLAFNTLSVEGTKIVMGGRSLLDFRATVSPTSSPPSGLQDIKQPAMVQLRRSPARLAWLAGSDTFDRRRSVYDTWVSTWNCRECADQERPFYGAVQAKFDFKSVFMEAMSGQFKPAMAQRYWPTGLRPSITVRK